MACPYYITTPFKHLLFKLVTLWHGMSLLHKNTIQAVPNRDGLITDGQKSTTKKIPEGWAYGRILGTINPSLRDFCLVWGQRAARMASAMRSISSGGRLSLGLRKSMSASVRMGTRWM